MVQLSRNKHFKWLDQSRSYVPNFNPLLDVLNVAKARENEINGTSSPSNNSNSNLAVPVGVLAFQPKDYHKLDTLVNNQVKNLSLNKSSSDQQQYSESTSFSASRNGDICGMDNNNGRNKTSRPSNGTDVSTSECSGDLLITQVNISPNQSQNWSAQNVSSKNLMVRNGDF